MHFGVLKGTKKFNGKTFKVFFIKYKRIHYIAIFLTKKILFYIRYILDSIEAKNVLVIL